MQVNNDINTQYNLAPNSLLDSPPPAGQPPIGTDPTLPPEKPLGNEDLRTPNQATAPIQPECLKEITASLSPGAWLAILCVKEAAKENEQSVKEVLSNVDVISKKLKDEASNIMKGAVAQLVCTVTMSAISMACTVTAGCKTLKADSSLQGIAANKAMVAPNNWTATAKASEQLGAGIGNFVNTLYQAENKEMEATVENARAAIENLRTHIQNQHDLMAKSLDFFNTMQANMNQTRARIMG